MNPIEADHIAIYVVDLDRSAAFYENVIGLKLIPEPFKDNRHTWFRTGPGSALHLIGGATTVSEHPIDVHMAFRVKSLDESLVLLDKAHVAYRSFAGDGKITMRPDGIRQTYLQDPDGYWIELNDDKG